MNLKPKKDAFKEDYLDNTDTLDVLEDIKDPLTDLDIDDSLETDYELESTEDREPIVLEDDPKPKKGFGFKRKQKTQEVNEVVEDSLDMSQINLEEFEDDSLSIEELEQRERIRQRQELARAEIERKKAERKAFLESFKTVGTLSWFFIYSAVGTFYIWWMTNQIIPAILVSFIGAYLLTFWFYYKQNELIREEREFKELTNIATQINFNMQNGKNVADTLEYIKDDYEGRVGADLNYTYSKLMAEGELVTDNFVKYNFKSFDIFLRNLQIAYHDGVEPKKLFKFPLSNINFEAIERDNLWTKNQASKKQEMMTMAIGIFIPFSLRLFAKEVFMAYLGHPLASIIGATLIYLVFVWLATRLQKTALDVAVSV